MAIVKVNLVPPHWPKIVNDLIKLGFSIGDIANAVGFDRQKIERMRRNGTSPKFEDGELLIQFWLEETGKTREDIPRMSRSDWRY